MTGRDAGGNGNGKGKSDSDDSDHEDVRAAVRLGWCLAEVRGRNRPDAPPGDRVDLPEREDWDLPLRIERSATERRIESQAAVQELARILAIPPHPVHGDLPAALDANAHRLWQARKAVREHPDNTPLADPAKLWEELAEMIWELDAHIQDTLGACSDIQASGYQLGRGLAESYWALEPGSDDGWGSWPFLLGERRCVELGRLAGRLSDSMNPLSAAAIAGSLQAWKDVASNKAWRRGDEAVAALHRQLRNWYALAVLDQDPTRLIRPYDLLKGWRVTSRALRIYLPQLLAGGLGVGALFGFIYLLGAKHPAHWLELVLGAASALGLSTASLTTKLKNEAQTLSTRLRQDAYTDLVAVSITTVPPPPDGKDRRQAVLDSVGRRELTPSSPPSA